MVPAQSQEGDLNVKKTFACLLVFLLFAGSAGAGYIFGGTNLSFTGYPEFDKRSPDKPFGREQWAASMYKDEVERYVKQAKEYVENAENDKQRIDEAISETIRKANKAVDEYNSWVQFGY